MRPGALDWPGLMRVGMQGLRLRPDEFWRLTPAELALMLGDPAAVPPMARSRLDALRAAWPDKRGPDKPAPDKQKDEGDGGR